MKIYLSIAPRRSRRRDTGAPVHTRSVSSDAARTLLLPGVRAAGRSMRAAGGVHAAGRAVGTGLVMEVGCDEDVNAQLSARRWQSG